MKMRVLLILSLISFRNGFYSDFKPRGQNEFLYNYNRVVDGVYDTTCTVTGNWQMTVAPGCTSTYYFNQSGHIRQYNCEQEDSLLGQVQLLGDSLILQMTGSIYSTHPDHGPGKHMLVGKMAMDCRSFRLTKRYNFINGEFKPSQYNVTKVVYHKII